LNYVNCKSKNSHVHVQNPKTSIIELNLCKTKINDDENIRSTFCHKGRNNIFLTSIEIFKGIQISWWCRGLVVLHKFTWINFAFSHFFPDIYHNYPSKNEVSNKWSNYDFY